MAWFVSVVSALVVLCAVPAQAQNYPAKLDFLGDAPSAMIGEAGVVVADDPRPVEARGQGDD